ncbi:MAG TPA: ABC transporter permease, partial [Gemmatimonadaceae bacterium]|nr:ABC transporter permease [Gemmatimonadaceae bacterium]
MRSRDFRAGVRRLLRLPLRTRAQIDADADDELRAFLAERVDDLVAHGMPLDDARAEALRRLGAPIDETVASLHNSALNRERRMRLRELGGDLRQDLHYAVRTLRRDLAFTVFAVAIIALGIGASATVFSVASALLLRPLPFAQPDRLVWIQNGNEPGLSAQTAQVNPYLSMVRANQSFSDLGAYMAFYGVGDLTISSATDAIRVSGVPVTQNFFPLLGVHPLIGRNFSAEESAWNGPRAVLLGYSLWQRRYASDPTIVGKPIMLNGAPTTVIGVLPPSFDFGSIFAPGARIDVYTPFPLSPETDRWGNTIAVIGRLKPGATLASASADLRRITPQIARENPNVNRLVPLASSLSDHVSGRARSGLLVLAFAVGVVMLIVCANLSNLLLARATTRQREMAIRAALGAGRRRLLRQMLTESVTLSVCGAVVGLALAWVGTRSIAHMDAVSLPLLGRVGLDASAVLFATALAIVAGLTFGLAPALQISEGGVHDTLKSTGRSATVGKRGQWLRRSLVIAEVALACILLVGSGLLIRSFLNVLDVDLGFRPDHVVAVRVEPDRQGGFKSDTEFVAYIDQVLALARQIPGVSAATIADGLPLGSNRSWGVSVGGEEFRKGRQWHDAFIRVATDGFVQAMGMHIVAGRDISPQDVKSGEQVVVINETAAKNLWPGQNALGKLLRVNGDRRVVGIVGDVRHLTVEGAAGNEIYLSLRQIFDYSSLTLIVRTSMEPTSLANTLRRTLTPVTPNLATNEVQTLDNIVDRAISPRRFFTLLLGGFSVFALVLALLGIYGVISYTVTHRTQEIGLRIALGATAMQVQRRIIIETVQ